ncbi:MAG: hypothetical protein AB8B69_16565 [Chitinophagales bacterium]
MTSIFYVQDWYSNPSWGPSKLEFSYTYYIRDPDGSLPENDLPFGAVVFDTAAEGWEYINTRDTF